MTERARVAGNDAADAAAISGSSKNASGKEPVWLGLNQQELDDAYDQARHAANAALVVQRYAINSKHVAQRLGVPRRFQYGPSPVEALDLFSTDRRNAPVLVFVHGGAWRSTKAQDYWFPAEAITSAGAHYAVLDFVNVLDAGGDLTRLSDQVRRGITWVAENASLFGGDRDRIYLFGHSSGAHLGSVMLVERWSDWGLPPDVVKGALLISGMYDLEPVRLSARSRYINFSDDMEAALSARRWIHRINCPVILMHGSLESPEFQRQSRDFATALQLAGKPVDYKVLDGYNHFEMLELLANPFSEVGRAALKIMGCSSPGSIQT